MVVPIGRTADTHAHKHKNIVRTVSGFHACKTDLFLYLSDRSFTIYSRKYIYTKHLLPDHPTYRHGGSQHELIGERFLGHCDGVML